jgi:hypothetical protein
MTMRVVLSGSLLQEYARAQVDNRKDSRAIAEAGTELAVDGELRRTHEQEAMNRTQLTQGMLQIGLQAASVALKTKDAVQTGTRVASEMGHQARLDTAAQSARTELTSTAANRSRGEAGEVGEAGEAARTREAAGPRTRELLDTVLTDQGTRVGDRFNERQLELLLGDRAGSPLSRRDLTQAGFSPEQATQLLELQGRGSGISPQQAVEFVFANRNAPVDVQANLATQRRDAAMNLVHTFVGELGNRALTQRSEGQRRGMDRAGEDRDRGREIRTGIFASRADDQAELVAAADALRRG